MCLFVWKCLTSCIFTTGRHIIKCTIWRWLLTVYMYICIYWGPHGRLAITCTYFVCAKCSYPQKIKALLTYLLTYLLTNVNSLIDSTATVNSFIDSVIKSFVILSPNVNSFNDSTRDVNSFIDSTASVNSLNDSAEGAISFIGSRVNASSKWIFFVNTVNFRKLEHFSLSVLK